MELGGDYMNQKLDNIKMIFIDIDGTLYNTEKQVTEYTKNILNIVKDKGIYVVLCSGRSNKDVCEISKDVNASKYVISSNGALVYNYVDDLDIFESVMEKESLEKMWTLCENEKKWELIIESKEQVYINELMFRRRPERFIKIDKIDDISNKNIFQMVLNIEESGKDDKVKEILEKEEKIWAPNYGVGVTCAFFDINNKNIDKGIGIKHLIENLGIKKEETIGFGDGVNDLAMFRECGIGVAMGNAEEKLKDMADYITQTNDEHGVAKFIEKYILDK